MKADAVLSRRLLLMFALPGLMLGFTHAPEAAVQGIYAKHGGVALAALGTALLLTRMFDALTYPLVGWLSDLTARRTGSRKPWLIAGTVVTVIGMWFLFQPPTPVGATYFLIWFSVTYVGWKLTEIPYFAWSLELTTDYAQRARVQVWRHLTYVIGLVLFYLMPYAAKALGMSASTELNFDALRLTAMVIALSVPLLNLLTIWRVGDGVVAPVAAQRRASARELWRALVRNRPLLHFLLAFTPLVFLLAVAASVSYLLIDSFLGLGKQLAAVSLLALPFSVIGIPVWGWLCQRYDRRRVLSVAIAASGVCYCGYAFLPPGPAALLPIMLVSPLVAFTTAALYVAPPALLGDIVDYGRLEYGEDHAGMYAAIFTLVQKSLGGIAAGIGLAVLGWAGFDAAAHEQSGRAVIAIRLISAWLPALGLFLSAWLFWRFPISRERHAQIKAALAAREAAASTGAA